MLIVIVCLVLVHIRLRSLHELIVSKVHILIAGSGVECRGACKGKGLERRDGGELLAYEAFLGLQRGSDPPAYPA